ncbi:hypothetical protein JHW43_000785 [Diplocarpon mali]|nr:hypothetical protein JHW43_000785 [Diplocarpon mali]
MHCHTIHRNPLQFNVNVNVHATAHVHAKSIPFHPSPPLPMCCSAGVQATSRIPEALDTPTPTPLPLFFPVPRHRETSALPPIRIQTMIRRKELLDREQPRDLRCSRREGVLPPPAANPGRGPLKRYQNAAVTTQDTFLDSHPPIPIPIAADEKQQGNTSARHSVAKASPLRLEGEGKARQGRLDQPDPEHVEGTSTRRMAAATYATATRSASSSDQARGGEERDTDFGDKMPRFTGDNNNMNNDDDKKDTGTF